jgi:hypothetical protein
MTDLETRLRTLRVDAHDGASPAELRRRATVRARRRRRRMIAASAVAVIVVAAAAGVAVRFTQSEPSDRVTTGPGPSPEPRTSPNRVIGDVDGVHVEVSPRTDLLDGDLVDVRVDGLENLGGAAIVQCAGDVTGDDASTSCDLSGSAVQPAGDDGGPSSATQVPRAAERQTVSITRTIHITQGSEDPSSPRPYDCATEEAGCVLVVGPLELPVRAVAVPLTFRDVPREALTAEIAPDTDLQDGDEVTLMAEGLRPNGSFLVQICEPAPGENCDEYAASTATTDADGVLRATVPTRAAIYGWRGRTDCTVVQCAVVVRLIAGERLVEVPLVFDEDVTAPEPALELHPGGPYSDGQEVIVVGSGFPAGVTLSGDLRQCPANLEPGNEGLCILSGETGGEVLVGSDGGFRATTRVWDTLPPIGHSCVTEPGCVFGWVTPHGPLIVSAPLDVEDSGGSG